MSEHQETPNNLEARNAGEMRRRLQNKWWWSPWRILPAPLIAYVVTGTYLWFVRMPDPWWHAITPVLTIAAFLIMRPIIQSWWFKREREKIDMET